MTSGHINKDHDYIKRNPQTTEDNTITLLQAGIVALTLISAVAGQDMFQIRDYNSNLMINMNGSGSMAITGALIFSPSSLLAVTGTTLPVSKGYHMVSGIDGNVSLSASPQIAAGSGGQLLILAGTDDDKNVIINNGSGVHVHAIATLGEHDVIKFIYDDADAEWVELSRNFAASEKSWSFASPSGASGTFYVGGYYDFASSDNDFNPAVTHGSANAAYAAHTLFVCAAGGSGGTDTVVRVTGTSINDRAIRTAGDTEDITIDDAGVAGAYYEGKKWIGQVSIEKQSGPDILCNYGFSKYWDSNNNDFRIVGIEVTGRAGANDNAPDILLRHHTSTGWTYNNGAAPTPPTAIATMNTDHSTESEYVNTEPFAWKRSNLDTTVMGGDSEGTIIEFVTTANRAVDQADVLLRVRPN